MRLTPTHLRAEICTFRFGPTPSNKVALVSFILFGGCHLDEKCWGAELAPKAFPANRDGSINKSEIEISWEACHPTTAFSWGMAMHRHIQIRGCESFYLNFGFIEKFKEAALQEKLEAYSCAPYWAMFEAKKTSFEWPSGEVFAKSTAAELHAHLGPDELIKSPPQKRL